MRRLLLPLLIAALLLSALPLAPAALAQHATPSVNGGVGPGEYGDHADGQNRRSTDTAQDWFMTWDEANLYVAVTNANLFEAAVVYIDRNPVAPVNGGSNADGSLSGFNYDNTSFSALPFRADFVAYVKHDYREYRNADGANGWTGSTAFFGSYAGSFSGNVREFSIPWSAVTGGGRPSSFNFFGYLTSPGGFVFGRAPNDNPGAFIGTAAAYSHYFAVSATADGASTRPFSQNRTVAGGDIQWDGLRHDTFDAYYRSPFGSVPAGSSVTLRFRTAHFDVDGVFVRLYTYDPATDTTAGPVDLPMSFHENRTEGGTEYDIWARTLTTPDAPAILYYKFRVTDGGDEDFYSDSYSDDHDNLNQGGEGAASEGEPFPSFQLTAYDPAFETPAWLRGANVYQIFPDRFRNGDPSNDYCRPGSAAGCPTFYGDQTPLLREPWNVAIGDPRQPGPFQNQFGTQFFGGDLKGIEQQLDYLQALGVDTIYLNPIFKARSNHRYDTDDYLEVDPALGGDAALSSLVAEAERRGVRLVFDGVFNHSSSDSRYFDRYHRYAAAGACESLASAFRSWYEFNTTNVPCGGADYPSWFGFDSLPLFLDGSPAVRDFFFRTPGTNVTQYWFDRGASGWRFDVATDLSHNWWHEYRPLAKSYKADGALIGENFPDASPYLAGDQLDSVMNYRFRKNVLGFARGANWSDNDNNGGNTVVGLTPSQFDRALRSVREDYPPQATDAMLNLLGSHDTNRALYVLTLVGDGGLNEAKERLKLSALFQFTYPGAPMVYYGDEGALNSPALGLGPNGPEDDPYNRAPYPWADEAGDAAVYGPVDGGVLGFYTTLAHLRKQHESLRAGSFHTLLTGDTSPAAGDDQTYAFARAAGAEAAVVALNNGPAMNTAAVPVGAFYADGAQLQDALSGATYTVSGGAVQLTLAARSGAVLLPFPAAVDLVAPVASVNTSPAPGAGGWHNALPVTVNLSATDAGSGVKELRYWVNDGPVVVAPGAAAGFALLQEGVYTVNVRAVDHAGNVSALVTQSVMIDATAPLIDGLSVSPTVLSTPNHKMVDIFVGYTVADDSGEAACALGVVSDEPVDGDGDGDTAPDWEVLDANHVRLRAERAGTGDGRVYTVTATCTDAAGNAASSSANVHVPRGKE